MQRLRQHHQHHARIVTLENMHHTLVLPFARNARLGSSVCLLHLKRQHYVLIVESENTYLAPGHLHGTPAWIARLGSTHTLLQRDHARTAAWVSTMATLDRPSRPLVKPALTGSTIISSLLPLASLVEPANMERRFRHLLAPAARLASPTPTLDRLLLPLVRRVQQGSSAQHHHQPVPIAPLGSIKASLDKRLARAVARGNTVQELERLHHQLV